MVEGLVVELQASSLSNQFPDFFHQFVVKKVGVFDETSGQLKPC